MILMASPEKRKTVVHNKVMSTGEVEREKKKGSPVGAALKEADRKYSLRKKSRGS